jgi:hypothetical protein
MDHVHSWYEASNMSDPGNSDYLKKPQTPVENYVFRWRKMPIKISLFLSHDLRAFKSNNWSEFDTFDASYHEST